MCLTRINGQHGRFKSGGIAHLNVSKTRLSSAWRSIVRATWSANMRLRLGITFTFLKLRQQHACNIYFAATNMAVHVNRTSHHHFSCQIIGLIYFFIGARFVDDAAIVDVNVLNDTIFAMFRIVNPTVFKLSNHVGLSLICSMTWLKLSKADGRTFFNGNETTLSMRAIEPIWSMPGIPTGINTSGTRSNCMLGCPMTMVGMSLGGGRCALKVLIHNNASQLLSCCVLEK